MASIDILENFDVHAPPDVVWRFLVDPHRVVPCLPGAQLTEVIDERTFNGSMRVKVGPITTSYKGRVSLTTVDEASYRVEMSAEGREGGGGSVRGSMTSELEPRDGGITAVTVRSHADITGRIAQFGRGLMQEVSHQLFQQFVSCAREQIERAAAEAGGADGGAAAEDVAVATAPGEDAGSSTPASPDATVTTPAPAVPNDAAAFSTSAAPSPGASPISTSAPPAPGSEAPAPGPVPPASSPVHAAAPGQPTAGVPAGPPRPAAARAPWPQADAKPVNMLSTVLKALWAMIVRWISTPFRGRRA